MHVYNHENPNTNAIGPKLTYLRMYSSPLNNVVQALSGCVYISHNSQTVHTAV
jgi:hypothetical protein